jgi:hypothetical protein
MASVKFIEDASGDLADLEFYCRADAPMDIRDNWPGGMETGYDQYCQKCGGHLAHGTQCPAECAELH